MLYKIICYEISHKYTSINVFWYKKLNSEDWLDCSIRRDLRERRNQYQIDSTSYVKL